MNIEQARTSGKKIFAIIDGKSVFYRGYYAMPSLSTRDGKPTGGVYGFAALALELVKSLNPDYVAVAWDKPKTNIRRRKLIYDGYKANRHPAPPDFYVQIPILHELLQALGWPLYEADDYEADDIMGTLSQLANKKGIHTVLITSDLDMLQLVDDDTEVYALKNGLSNLQKIDVTTFEQKYGLRVDQFLDLKSLKGDSSDNIPGVAGIGEKTASSLLQKYDNLDSIYDHIDEITGTTQRKLIDGKDSAYMSRELAKIWCDAPIPLNLEATDINNLDQLKLHQVLVDLEFTSLIKRLPSNMTVDNKEIKIDTSNDTVNSVALLPELTISNDIPGELANPVVVNLANEQLLISDDQKTAYNLSFTKASKLLANHQIVVHDAKALAKAFLARNLPISFRIEFDTKHASFLIDSLRKPINLTDYLINKGVLNSDQVSLLQATISLWHELSAELNVNGELAKLATQVDFPLQLVLARIEERGVQIDVDILAELSVKLGREINVLEQAIWQQVGYEFNVASPSQLSKALFDELRLPITAKRNTRGVYPTGAKILAKLAGKHPVIDLIVRYRELAKLKSTYVDALPKNIGADGRIHTTLDQDVTSTGRLSSSNPNLQNIPTRTERGREIKRAFTAPTGKVIISADYAQFELRLAAALASDTNMITMFNSPANDIHRITAAEAYGISPDQVTPEQRRHAKVINFGVLYGMSPHGLADATDMNFNEAKEFIEKYFAIRQPIRNYIDRTLKQADELGYVETLFGRRRYTPDVKSSNYMVREAAKRAAANMPIQGTEADLMKMAMLRVEQIAEASQIMQIHDSIIVECDSDRADNVANQMKDIMENIYPKLGVKLLVDVKIGTDWSEL